MDLISLNLLMDNIPLGILTQEKGILANINQAGKYILGAGRTSEVLGRTIFDFLHKDHHLQMVKYVDELSHNKVKKINEVKMLRLNQEEFDAEITIIQSNQERELQYILIEDVTILKRSKKLLEKSDNLMILGELAAGIAHEIRNPLTSLKGFLQLMDADSHVNHTYSEIMLVEIERINLIVGELLQLVKPKEIEVKKVQIIYLLDTVITLLSSQAILANVQIITHYTKGVNQLVIFGEGNKIKQVFINIIKNAIEAMPHGGKIIVLVDSKDGYVQVNVIDQGHGIPKDELDKIGKAFYTTKESGMGLGLMVTKNIIEQHGGSINFKSEQEKGTIVEVNFPIKEN